MTESTTDDAFRRETVTVCHKNVTITDVNERSYTGEVELGGVVQHVVLSASYVHDRLACDRDGCLNLADDPSPYCSADCVDEARTPDA